jgi:hypothetical protein
MDKVTPRSQHELRALASMVVASLPFPPLPVMVMKGDEGADGMASSYDLLQTAVMNSTMLDNNNAQSIAESKQATLAALQRNIALINVSSFGCDFPTLQAYEIYCGAFREYLLKHYATSTQDLRFYPLDAVSCDSLLMQQGISHWKAGQLLSGDVDAGKNFASYEQLIAAYAQDLAMLHE